MAGLFSASEIVQIGIQIEKNGKEFYTVLAKSSKSENGREIFRYLAQEEDRHIKVFEDILSSIENYEPGQAYTEEYFSYLAALSKECVFTKEKVGEQIAKRVKDDMEAVETGIGFEKDSILFYHEIKGMVWKKGQQIIERLIEEERGHLRKLFEVKEGLLS